MRATAKELKDTLWKAADKLRGSMSAGQYMDVVLGLVYLLGNFARAEGRRLSAFRDAMLPQLTSGKLRVTDTPR